MMAFYDSSKQERAHFVAAISNDILTELKTAQLKKTVAYFGNEDTYIRKSAYLSGGRSYFTNKMLQPKIIKTPGILLLHDDFKIRQTVINSAGEIGKTDFENVQQFFDKALFDKHHSPRNAVIGSIKKMQAHNILKIPVGKIKEGKYKSSVNATQSSNLYYYI